MPRCGCRKTLPDPLATLARVIGLPERTLARREKERRLRADESDRLLRVARVATSAEDVLGAQAKAGGAADSQSGTRRRHAPRPAGH